MNAILESALQAMQSDVSRLERLGSNLANALTPGYKREVLVQRAAGGRFAETLRHEAAAAASSAAPASAGSRVLRDLRPGTLKATGQAHDLALAGPGFFEIHTPAGPGYTRNGEFRVDAQGRLVTVQGHPVMGRGGPIVLVPGAVAIDTAGTVRQGASTVGQLRVVQFDAPQTLQPGADGFFAGGERAHPVADADLHVRQGFLENANVDPMHEMVELMRTTRHFESMSRVLQSCDDMLGSAIRRLGEI